MVLPGTVACSVWGNTFCFSLKLLSPLFCPPCLYISLGLRLERCTLCWPKANLLSHQQASLASFLWPEGTELWPGLLMCYTEKEKVPNVGSSYLSQKLWLFSWFNFVAENITSSNKLVCCFGNADSENLFPFVTRCKRMGKGYSLKTKFFTRELHELLCTSHGRRMLVVICCECS